MVSKRHLRKLASALPRSWSSRVRGCTSKPVRLHLQRRPPMNYFPYAWAIWPTSLAQPMSMAP